MSIAMHDATTLYRDGTPSFAELSSELGHRHDPSGVRAIHHAGATAAADRHSMMRWLLFILLLLAGDVRAQGLITNIAVKPGPSPSLFSSQPYYACTNNRYVSVTGSAGNNGLTAGTPWDVNTAIAYVAPAGTCINFAPGLYAVGTGLIFTHGGTGPTTTGYVVWRCTSMPFGFSNGVLQGEGGAGSCHLQGSGVASQGGQVVILINVPWTMVDGFELDGNTAALTCFDNENSNGANHHSWLLNSTLHHCQGQSGVQFNETDWGFFLHNVWHDNANNSAPGNGIDSCGCNGSGFTIYQPVVVSGGYTPTAGNPDYWHSVTSGLTYNLVIAYNVGYNNTDGPRTNTDGEGIIIDSFGGQSGPVVAAYTGSTLVMGNIMYNNGANGISVVFDNAAGATFCGCPKTIVNNTTYANAQNSATNANWGANLLSNRANATTWINNISYTTSTNHQCPENPGGTLPSCSFLTGNSGGTANIFGSNYTYPSGNLYINAAPGNAGTPDSYLLTGATKNVDGTNPNFINASVANPNFALAVGSALIGAGQAFDLWQSGGAVDVGACGSTLTICP